MFKKTKSPEDKIPRIDSLRVSVKFDARPCFEEV